MYTIKKVQDGYGVFLGRTLINIHKTMEQAEYNLEELRNGA